MVISRGSYVYTLDLSVALSNDELQISGSISYNPSTPVSYTGGWTYSVANGLETDPGSQSGFEDTVIQVFGCDPQNPLALNLADALQFAANVIIMGVNYVIDLFTPYTAPTQCDGPLFFDGSGQSCEGRTISCKDDLDEMSELIDNLTGVSDGFKQCMKGRAGCGGSAFERLQVSCGSSSDCGPCGNAAGCNIGGTRIWYCENENKDECGCARTIFHEMAHACGQFDDPDCENPNNPSCPSDDPDDYSGACRTGFMMNEECCDFVSS